MQGSRGLLDIIALLLSMPLCYRRHRKHAGQSGVLKNIACTATMLLHHRGH